MSYEDEDELDRIKARRQNKQSSHVQRQRGVGNEWTDSELKSSRRQSTHAIQRRRKKRKRNLLIAEILILLVLVVAAVFIFKKKTDGYWTIAVFGVDSRDGNLDKGALSDVEMICNINKATGEITLVSVFRDTYLRIDSDGKYHKINEAYFKGGHKQAVDALNANLDLNIDDYATFNWKAVADTINILGGIDLEITDKEFHYINSFITETVESTGIASVHLTNAGANHLDGVQAVAYARLRLMDTDFNRTARQRKVISLAMEKAKQADWSVLNNILVTVLPQVSTSIGVNDIIPIARNLNKYHIGETAGFPFSRGLADIGKLDCVIPTTLESNVIELHRFLFGEENYSPSATVRKISDKIAKDSGLDQVGTNAAPDGTGSGSSHKPTQAQTQAPAVETTETSEVPPTETTVEETTVTETDVVIETITETSKPNQGNIGPGANLKETTKGSAEKTTEGKSGEEKPSKESAKETSPESAETKPVGTKPAEVKPNETAAVSPEPGHLDSNASSGPGAR